MKIRGFGTNDEIKRIYEGEDGRCVIEVMCNDDRHTIIVDKTGKVTVPVSNHTEEEQTLSRLGDDEPLTACMRVKKEVKKSIRDGHFVC